MEDKKPVIINTSSGDGTVIGTVEMHTAGEPFRIVVSGYPVIHGESILQKRRFAMDNLDHLRKMLMLEPRGHADMYGCLLVEPDEGSEAHLGVLFMHCEGYSTMCGHGVIALAKYAVDYGVVKATEPETHVRIQCPCGPVNAYVRYSEGEATSTRFESVPSYAVALDVKLMTKWGAVKVDIGFGGAFYAVLPAASVGLEIGKDKLSTLHEAADVITGAVREQVTLTHPENKDLAFIYGTIFTDSNDGQIDEPTVQFIQYADSVDRSPCGSGVTARVAILHSRRKMKQGQRLRFRSAIQSEFTGMVVREEGFHGLDSVIVEVAGRAFYTGKSTFTYDPEDGFKHGFLLK